MEEAGCELPDVWCDVWSNVWSYFTKSFEVFSLTEYTLMAAGDQSSELG